MIFALMCHSDMIFALMDVCWDLWLWWVTDMIFVLMGDCEWYDLWFLWVYPWQPMSNPHLCAAVIWCELWTWCEILISFYFLTLILMCYWYDHWVWHLTLGLWSDVRFWLVWLWYDLWVWFVTDMCYGILLMCNDKHHDNPRCLPLTFKPSTTQGWSLSPKRGTRVRTVIAELLYI